ncbi:hypothetical protein KKA13_03510 [Patescibacteria group bacterium]|nr:hypothetical protein [Patescibacteria group bacterium]MBU1613513.1 hypothetical protein [Patescibacteria group bacterium]
MLIIATIGLNSFDEGKIKKIILSGANILRFNLSSRTIDNNIKYIQTAQQIIYELNSKAKIMIDLPLNKVRLGDFPEKVIEVKENQELIFRCGFNSPNALEYIPVQMTELAEKVKINQVITIGDGEISLQVTDIIDKQSIAVKALNNGSIYFMRSFNTNWRIADDKLIEQYKQLLDSLKDVSPKYFAVSYLNNIFAEKVKQIFSPYPHARVIAKLERHAEKEEIEALCRDDFYRYVLIDRGEMGVNAPFEKIGILQKKIVRKAHEHKKHVIVSTHILESSINNLIPYRAEITDLTNMVLEGVDGIMLCHETAVGLRPAYTISIAKKIIAEAEKYKLSLKPPLS